MYIFVVSTCLLVVYVTWFPWLQCLEMARYSLLDEVFQEVEMTCMFVGQLANFNRDWRLHLPESLNKILVSF